MKPLRLKTCILFWTAIVCALFLGSAGLLRMNGLQFRIRIREPVTMLIAAGAAAGLFQLVLHIPKKVLKIICIVLWALALIAFCIFGYVYYALLHRWEISQNAEFEGKRCIIEEEPLLWDSDYLYFEYHNWFVHGSEVLQTTHDP